MKRLTIKGFDFTSDFVASHLQSWPIAEALKKLQQIEDATEERELHQTIFDQITDSMDALATILEGLPAMGGPWDDAFHREFCDACQFQDCAGKNCPHQEIRQGRVRWWLKQGVKPGERGL